MNRSILISTALLALAAFAAPGAAQAQDLAAAVRTGDPVALAALTGAGSAPEARLARAALAALNNDDAEALPGLRAAARSGRLAPELRLGAYQALASVYLRQGRFAEAAAAMRAGAALGVTQAPERAHAYAQAQSFADALSDAAPMRAATPAAGEITLTRDLAQLLRADVAINDAAPVQAVVDTGAAFSTIASSVAERLGLRLIDAPVTVGSSSSNDVPARLAIAETLRFAGGEFHDVVFIVFPDEALTFAGGAYKIDAIIGLPVLMQFGRLEFALGPAGDTLRYRRSGAAVSATPNLALDGVQPVAIVGAGDAALRMLVDTGAQRTSLSHIVERDFPALIARGETRSTTIGGAGGTRTESEALAIPELTLDVAGQSVALADVRLLRQTRAMERHGILGQDVLRAHGGYVLDFETMRFELLPRAAG